MANFSTVLVTANTNIELKNKGYRLQNRTGRCDADVPASILLYILNSNKLRASNLQQNQTPFTQRENVPQKNINRTFTHTERVEEEKEDREKEADQREREGNRKGQEMNRTFTFTEGVEEEKVRRIRDQEENHKKKGDQKEGDHNNIK